MTEQLEAQERDIVAHVGATVRRLRTDQKMSVSELAIRADVSRRMLTAIESGTANASLVTLDKVARALSVDFSVLVRQKSDKPIEIVSDSEAKVVWTGPLRGSTGRLFAATRSRGSAEMWDWSLQSGDRYRAQPDPAGSEEILAVSTGTLTLAIDGHEHEVEVGSVVRFATDRPYAYINNGDGILTFTRIVVINTV